MTNKCYEHGDIYVENASNANPLTLAETELLAKYESCKDVKLIFTGIVNNGNHILPMFTLQEIIQLAKLVNE